MKKNLLISTFLALPIALSGCDNYPDKATMEGVIQTDNLPENSSAIFFKMEPKDLINLKIQITALGAATGQKSPDYYLTNEYDEILAALPQNSDGVNSLKKTVTEFRSSYKEAQENWEKEGVQAEITKLQKQIESNKKELDKVKVVVTGYESELATPNEKMEQIKTQIANLEPQIDADNTALLKQVNQIIIDQRIPAPTYSDSTNVVVNYSYHDLAQKSTCNIEKANYFSKYDIAIKNDGKCFNIQINNTMTRPLKGKVDWSDFGDQAMKIASAHQKRSELKKKMREQRSAIRSAETVANNLYPNYSQGVNRYNEILSEIDAVDGEIKNYQQANVAMPELHISKPYSKLNDSLAKVSDEIVFQLVSDFTSEYVVGRSKIDSQGNFEMASGANMMALAIFSPYKKAIPSYLNSLEKAIYSRENKDPIYKYSIALYDIAKYQGEDEVLRVKNLEQTLFKSGRLDGKLLNKQGITKQHLLDTLTFMQLTSLKP